MGSSKALLLRALELPITPGNASRSNSMWWGLVSRRNFGQRAHGHQLDREAVVVTLTRLQRAHTDNLARDLFTPFIGNRDHHAVFALLASRGVMNRPLDAHRGDCLRGRLRVDGIEAQ